MNTAKRIRIVLLAGLVFLGAGLYMLLRDTSSGVPVFSIPDRATPLVVEMHGRGGEVTLLELGDDGNWLVNGEHRADDTAVRELITVLWEATVRRPLPLGRSADMDAFYRERGIEVLAYTRDHLIGLPLGIRLFPRLREALRIQVGQDDPDGSGTAMRVGEEGGWYWVHLPGIQAGLNQVFSGGESRYRSRMLLHIRKREIRQVFVEVPGNGEGSFVLVQDEGGLTGVKDASGRAFPPDSLNLVRLERFLTAFEGLYYDRKPSVWEPREEFLRIRLVTVAGDQHEMRFYRRPPPPGILMDPANRVEYDPDRFYLETVDG